MVRYILPIALILLAGCPSPREQAIDAFTRAQLYRDDGDLDKAILMLVISTAVSAEGLVRSRKQLTFLQGPVGYCWAKYESTATRLERFLSQLAGRCHAGTIPEGASY